MTESIRDALKGLAGSALIGLCHGLLVTKLKLQPFLVTLCGLFIYRGIARTLSQTTVGLRVALPMRSATIKRAATCQLPASANSGTEIIWMA